MVGIASLGCAALCGYTLYLNNKSENKYDVMYRNYKAWHNSSITYSPINLKPTELLVGYDKILRPIIVNMKKTPHIGIMGSSNVGKSKCVEAMIRNLKGADVTLVNTFNEDFTSAAAKRVNGFEEIEAFLKSELDNKTVREKPHYIVIDECNVLSLESKIDKIIKGLLAQARHFNVYLICILQLANKNDCMYKNLFNTRISFKHIDSDLIKTFIGSSPENVLKLREFYMYSTDYFQGKTYII